MTFFQERLLLLFLSAAALIAGTAFSKRQYVLQKSVRAESLSIFLLVVLFILGFIIRIYAVDFDFPFNFHHDERWKISVVKNIIMSRDLNPHYFNHPSLLLYCTALSHMIFHGFFEQLDMSDQIKVAGRLVSVFAGSLSTVLLVLLSRKFMSKTASYLAGLLFSVFPLSVLASIYLKEDMLFVSLLLIFFNIYVLAKSSTNALLLGLTFGLCCGTKYTGVLLFVFIAPRLLRMTIKESTLLIVSSCVGFLITTPYALIDFNSFYEGIMYEKRHMAIGNTIPISFGSELGTYHLIRSILYHSSLLFWLATAVGFGSMIAYKKFLPCVAFILFYCAAEIVKAKIEPEPARYILPCIPFVCMGVTHLFDQNLLGKLLSSFVIIALSFRTYGMMTAISHDSRLDMLSYINKEISFDKKILIDHKFNNPQFNEDDPRISYLSVRPLTRGYPEVMNKKVLTEMNIDYVLVSNLTYQCLYFCKESSDIAKRSVKRLFAHFEIVHESFPKSGSFAYHEPYLTLFKVSGEALPDEGARNLEVLSRSNPFTYNLW